MKLADYVATFFSQQGISHAFVVSGGASLHLIHGIKNAIGIEYICCHHEQAAAMAADAYARVTGGLGLAVATSGPGATNLITGVCGCFYDSVPVVFLTGQVSTFRMSGDSGVRQVGFQETPIIDMCRPVTKHCVQILDASDIRYELEKAVYIATTGRPGPVIIDIPDNIQRETVDPSSLRIFRPEYAPAVIGPRSRDYVLQIIRNLEASCRPIIIGGWGVHLAKCEDKFRQLVQHLNVPVALTWGGSDLLPHHETLRVGTFGTHGTRYANFAVQNADFILTLGARLDTKSTGSPPGSFARGAWKAVVDIDGNELQKFSRYGLKIDCLINEDVSDVITALLNTMVRPRDASWIHKIDEWKRSYHHSRETRERGLFVDPYCFFDALSDVAPDSANFLVDTGSAVAWMMQAFRPKPGQRIWHDYNNTAMGWALPASIASSLANPDFPTFCIVGDGSLMMNIQELATIVKLNLNVKIFCLDNKGYSMIQQTQDQWLNSDYVASSEQGGLGFPDLLNVANAFGILGCSIQSNENLASSIRSCVEQAGAFFCNVSIDPVCRVVPQVKFGRPNEDPEPLICREEFVANMFVPPLSVST